MRTTSSRASTRLQEALRREAGTPAGEDQGTLMLVLPPADGCDLSMLQPLGSKIPPSSYFLFYKELDEWFPQDLPASLDGGWGREVVAFL